MNIYHVRQILRTKSIYDIELRVVYYARVSTDKEEQKNSIMHQREHFESFIKSNKKWKFCGGYIDDGISGIHAEKREQFQQMLSDAKNDKFDLIVTKEISRFARNTLDSIQYTRQLLGDGVCVWFQNDNINTIDEDSEFRLTIMAGVAQDEVRKLSSRVRFGHTQSIKNGVVLGNSHIYGYDKKDGRLTINEKEAYMIQLIFDKYATGLYSTPMIEKMLYDMGYRNYKGGKINRGVIGHIIQNPKYKGFYVGGKVKIVDMFTKKQEFVPEEEWIMYKDDGEHVPAIVDENIWNKANFYFKQRSEAIKTHRTSYKRENLFTGKIYCGNDNSPYWLKQRTVRGKSDAKWVCSHRIKNGAESCNSFGIGEDELKIMLVQILNSALDNFDCIVEKYLSLYQKIILNKTDNTDKIKKLKDEIKSIQQRAEKILDYNLSGQISDKEFLRRNELYTNQIEQLQNQIDLLSQQEETPFELKKRMELIKSKLIEFYNLTEDDISCDIVNRLVSKILVYPCEDKCAKVEIYINDGSCYSGTYQKNKMSCSDNIFLIMLSERHTVFYRRLRSFDGHLMPVKYICRLMA